jgi:hypothetical protein
MRLTVIAALALSSLCAQQFPDGETLNEQAAAAVKRLHSLQYKEEMTTETAFGDQNLKMTTESSRAVLNPGKMRVESKVQGLTMLIVSDGESTWTYSSMNNEYTRKSAALGPQGVMDAMGMGAMMPSLADVHLTPKTTGEESVVIDGQKHDCWVVHTDIGAMVLPAAAKGRQNLRRCDDLLDRQEAGPLPPAHHRPFRHRLDQSPLAELGSILFANAPLPRCAPPGAGSTNSPAPKFR